MLQSGTVLDNKYQIEAVIGQGGFGYVYRARERLTGETVAIKQLVPSFMDDEQLVRRFIQEARATLRLTHPHIARTHTIFADRNTYYLAMEYLPGGSLADRLQGAPLRVEEAVRVARDLCSALAYAHQEGVVHCDIKPANVLFDKRGRARLADFGIAHVSERMMTRRFFTSTGVTMGTVRYMAPEQLEGVRDDPRLDVYAVGALLYEMLAGRPYLDFEEETTPAAQMRNMQRIQSAPPRPLRSLNPSVPEHVAGVVEHALRKAPAERFGSVERLRQALAATSAPTVERHRVERAAAPTRAMPQEQMDPRARHGEYPVEAVEDIAKAPVTHGGPDASAGPRRRIDREPAASPSALDDVRKRLAALWELVPIWTRAVAGLGLVALVVTIVGVVVTLGGAEPSVPALPVASDLAGPQGPLIYFVSNQDGRREIYRLTLEAERIRVTNTPGGESWSPAVGPDGMLHFTSTRDGKREIYRLTSDADVVRVTNTPGGESWSPAVGPDGVLHFTSNRDGPCEIYRLTSDAGTVRVTNTPGGESWSPVVGPDGILRFTSTRDGKREIYRLTTDAGAVRVTSTPRGESWSPAVGPNGTLHFTSNRDGKREIYRLTQDAGVVRVTNTPRGESWFPRLGADGLLYFTSNRDGGAEVYRLTSREGAVRVTYTREGESWLSSEE